MFLNPSIARSVRRTLLELLSDLVCVQPKWVFWVLDLSAPKPNCTMHTEAGHKIKMRHSVCPFHWIYIKLNEAVLFAWVYYAAKCIKVYLREVFISPITLLIWKIIIFHLQNYNSRAWCPDCYRYLLYYIFFNHNIWWTSWIKNRKF